METFSAQCITHGNPRGAERRDIEAASFLDAARQVYGEPLQAFGPAERECLRVCLQRVPRIRMSFYSAAAVTAEAKATEAERIDHAPGLSAPGLLAVPTDVPLEKRPGMTVWRSWEERSRQGTHHGAADQPMSEQARATATSFTDYGLHLSRVAGKLTKVAEAYACGAATTEDIRKAVATVTDPSHTRHLLDLLDEQAVAEGVLALAAALVLPNAAKPRPH